MSQVNSIGQVTVEFSICFVVVIFVVAGVIRLLVSQWQRSQCAYLVFETVHSRLVGKRPPASPYRIRLIERAETVEGIATCGESTERVILPRLEAAQW